MGEDATRVFSPRATAMEQIDSAMVWVLDSFSLVIGLGAGLCLALAFWAAIRAGGRLEPIWRGVLRGCLGGGVILIAAIMLVVVTPRFEAMCAGCGWSFAQSGLAGAVLFGVVLVAIRAAR